jgi:phosphohistidine phosphatase SixA
MKKIAIVALGALLCAVAAHTGAAPEPDGTHWGAEGAALVERLRAGGHVLFFRHERTLAGTADRQPPDFSDCATQRGLSPAGIESARATGEALKALAIPIGVVLASPYCRNLETARLLAGRATAEAALLGPERPLGRGPDAAVADLERLVARHGGVGDNAVFVGHFGNLLHARGIRLAEGDAALLVNDPRAGLQIVRVVSPALWDDLLRDESRRTANSVRTRSDRKQGEQP